MKITALLKTSHYSSQRSWGLRHVMPPPPPLWHPLQGIIPEKVIQHNLKAQGRFGGQALSPPITGNSQFVKILGFQQSENNLLFVIMTVKGFRDLLPGYPGVCCDGDAGTWSCRSFQNSNQFFICQHVCRVNSLINPRYPLCQWRELYLIRKGIGSRQVALIIHEHSSEDEHLIVRNGYLPHFRREISPSSREANMRCWICGPPEPRSG